MTTPGKPAFGGTVLRIPAIQSPNYVPGISGWAIFQNGTVEFNSGTFRGTVTAGEFDGTDFVINSAGAFFYSATPALGNLTASITVPNITGTDAFGNHWFGGFASYDQSSNSGVAISQFQLVFLQNTGAGTAWTTTTGIFQALSPGAGIELSGPGFWSYGGVPVLGGIVASAPSDATGKTPETWHAVTYAGTWNTAGSDILKYRLMPDNSVWIHGRISNTANQVSGNTIATLPSGYFNTTRTTWGTNSIANASTVMPMQLTSAGALQILNSYALGTALIINMRIPLDIT